MAISIWNNQAKETLKEFLDTLHDITQITVLSKERYDIWSENGHTAIVERTIERATEIAVVHSILPQSSEWEPRSMMPDYDV